MAKPTVTLNGITYRWPERPVVVVCIDGGDPAYIQRGLRDGIIPTFKKFIDTGFHAIADGTVPSFTCPNNMSIITGSPPSVHGISGNFYLNPQGKAVVMTGPEPCFGRSGFLARMMKRVVLWASSSTFSLRIVRP